MCLGNNPCQSSVFWYEDENLVHFKYPLPSGTKHEDVKVEIDEDGNLLITVISKVVEGDTASPLSMKFNLPAGLDPAGFKIATDDAGVLTVTFTKPKPQKKKLVSIAKKMLGFLAHVVPACFVIGANIDDAMSSGDY